MSLGSALCRPRACDSFAAGRCTGPHPYSRSLLIWLSSTSERWLLEKRANCRFLPFSTFQLWQPLYSLFRPTQPINNSRRYFKFVIRRDEAQRERRGPTITEHSYTGHNSVRKSSSISQEISSFQTNTPCKLAAKLSQIQIGLFPSTMPSSVTNKELGNQPYNAVCWKSMLSEKTWSEKGVDKVDNVVSKKWMTLKVSLIYSKPCCVNLKKTIALGCIIAAIQHKEVKSSPDIPSHRHFLATLRLRAKLGRCQKLSLLNFGRAEYASIRRAFVHHVWKFCFQFTVGLTVGQVTMLKC